MAIDLSHWISELSIASFTWYFYTLHHHHVCLETSAYESPCGCSFRPDSHGWDWTPRTQWKQDSHRGTKSQTLILCLHIKAQGACLVYDTSFILIIRFLYLLCNPPPRENISGTSVIRRQLVNFESTEMLCFVLGILMLCLILGKYEKKK